MEAAPPPPADTARVFFALWPSDEVRGALVQAADALHARHGGRRMQAHSLHLTLVFIGQVEAERIPELKGVAEAIRGPSFETLFDQPECWRHNRIACLGASLVPPELPGLVAALEAGLRAAGVDFDKRPYKPHITLLRNADCRKPLSEQAGEKQDAKKNPAWPIRWPARDFVLVKSSLRPDGARYEELGRWPLL